MEIKNESEVLGNATGEIIQEVMFQIWGITGCTISLVGIPGNILVIISVLTIKHLRTAPNFLVLNLSVCDLLFLSFAVPPHACSFLSGKVCIGDLCWLGAFLTNWLLGVSVLSTAAIAINRYIAIVVSSKYKHISDTKVVIAMCLGVYIFCFVLISPTLSGLVGSFGYDQSERLCRWQDAEIVMVILIFCIGICPLIFMTACYLHILLFVIASRKKVGVLGQGTSVSVPRRTYEAKLSLMLAMVYVVYLVTTFPSFLLNVLGEVGVSVSRPAWISSFVLLWTSAALNPIVYGLVNKKYREAYKAVALRLTRPFR